MATYDLEPMTGGRFYQYANAVGQVYYVATPHIAGVGGGEKVRMRGGEKDGGVNRWGEEGRRWGERWGVWGTGEPRRRPRLGRIKGLAYFVPSPRGQFRPLLKAPSSPIPACKHLIGLDLQKS